MKKREGTKMISFNCNREFMNLPHGIYFIINKLYHTKLDRNDGMSSYRRLYNSPTLTYDFIIDGSLSVKSEILNIKQKQDII